MLPSQQFHGQRINHDLLVAIVEAKHNSWYVHSNLVATLLIHIYNAASHVCCNQNLIHTASRDKSITVYTYIMGITTVSIM